MTAVADLEIAGREPLDRTETAPAEQPADTAPVRLLLAVEGIDTSDGRHIEPGALSTRPMPLTIYAQVRSTHGQDGDAATYVVGAITEAERLDGPEVIQRSTGAPFPAGTFAWVGKGWMYRDVPGPESGSKPAFTLMKDKALYGNSVDLTTVDASFEYGEDDDDDHPRRIVMHSGVIGSTTIVGIPAFMDAFVEMDGEILTAPADAIVAAADALEAGPRLSWAAPELGDPCRPCALGDGTPDLAEQDTAALLGLQDLGDDIDPADLHRTTGMVALIPTNPAILTAPGGDPAEQLHLTLAYLGDEIDTWDPDQVAAVHRVALQLTNRDAQLAAEDAAARDRGEDPQPSEDVREYRSAGQKGPLQLNVFAHAVFNPNGRDVPGDKDPATVYLFTGEADYLDVMDLQMSVVGHLRDALGTTTLPEQHAKFEPHVTAGYNLDVSQLTYTGPVEFNRMRVAIGDAITDYPLGGDAISEAVSGLAAAGVPLPPAAIFADPQLAEPTPITVDENGTVRGHIALWGSCHTTFAGQCVTPPSSPSGYAYYRVHSTRAVDENGDVVTVPVGYGTVGTGHASVRANALAAAEHYDNTGTAVMELAAGEDAHGIWVAGRLMPGLDEVTEHKARGAAFSGDWRKIRGSLELVATLGVVTPGFPVPAVRVASGTPMALVAAGLVPAPQPDGEPADQSAAQLAEVIGWVYGWALGQEQARLAADLAADPPGHEGSIGPFPGQHRDPHVYARDIHSGAGNCVCGSALADAVHVQAAPGVPVPEGMRVELSDWAEVQRDTEVLLALEGDHPWFSAEDDERAELLAQLEVAGAVALVGRKTLHLPAYIKRIEKHLQQDGMSKSRAIATAVNVAKKMCATGDLNWPGKQKVNPGSRAEACAAVAQWKKDRPGATS